MLARALVHGRAGRGRNRQQADLIDHHASALKASEIVVTLSALRALGTSRIEAPRDAYARVARKLCPGGNKSLSPPSRETSANDIKYLRRRESNVQGRAAAASRPRHVCGRA